MNQKAKKKSLPDAIGSPPKTAPVETAEHPSQTLFDTLNALHLLCSNAHLFRELAERRNQSRHQHMDAMRPLCKAASDRANTKTRCGDPFTVDFSGFDEVKMAMLSPPPSNESPEGTKTLLGILDEGQTLCKWAREALGAGGAKGLDAATQHNAAGQSRSIELHTKLQDAERVFAGLKIGVDDPRIVIDNDAASMADLGEWFARTRDEMVAVFETRGLDAEATPTGSTVTPRAEALPAGADESAAPALTMNQSRVLQTMARFDVSRLLTSKMIAEEMDAPVRLSEETVRQCVGKLIDANLAERPEGDRSGARLNNAGRKLAGKIAD